MLAISLLSASHPYFFPFPVLVALMSLACLRIGTVSKTTFEIAHVQFNFEPGFKCQTIGSNKAGTRASDPQIASGPSTLGGPAWPVDFEGPAIQWRK